MHKILNEKEMKERKYKLLSTFLFLLLLKNNDKIRIYEEKTFYFLYMYTYK